MPPLALCLVWCTSHADAGWLHPPAHWQCRSRSMHRVADPGRDRLGVPDVQRQARPAQPGAELLSGAGTTPARPGPDSRSTALPMTACSSAAQAASRAPSRRRASSSTHSRTRSSRASTFTSPVTIGAIAASQAIAPAASPSSQAPSLAAGLGRGRAVRGPPLPDLRGPLLLQRRVAVQQQQVGQRDVHPDLHRLPGPLRQQVRGDQPPHRLGRARRGTAGPVVRSSSSSAGAPARPAPAPTTSAHSGVRSPCTTPGAAERGRQLQRRGPAKSRSGSSSGRSTRARSYICAASAASSSSAQPAPPRPRAAARRTRPGTSPAACPVHRQISRPDRLGDLPGRQRRQHLRMRATRLAQAA